MKLNDLAIVWRHVADRTARPLRCSDTGRLPVDVVESLRPVFTGNGISITFNEEIIPENSDEQRTVLLFNGIPLEEIVPLPDPRKYCTICGNKCGNCGEVCRVYDEIPESVFRLAAMKASGLK